MKSPFRLQAILFLFALLAIAVNTQGQKDPKRNITQVKELPLLKAHITKEIEGQIIEIVKPVKEKIETLYKEDNTGTYTAYATDMQKLGEIKDVKERMAYAKNIQKKYYSFVKKTWDQAKIDEGYYQQKLKNLFPGNVKETIRFGEFLNFTMGSSFQKPIPPPPPPPGPANICVNANSMFSGAKTVEGGAIGGAKVILSPANPPSPTEMITSADAVLMGIYKAEGWIHNTLSIPGNFPFDNKSLRAKKTFDWYGSGMAFSLLGCAWSTVAYTTNGNTSDFSVDGEIYTVVAPVTFVLYINQRTSKTEESVIAKTDLRTAQFGITCYSSASSSIFLSYSHANSSCAMTKWDICEE